MGKSNEGNYQKQCRQIFGPTDGQRIYRKVLFRRLEEYLIRRRRTKPENYSHGFVGLQAGSAAGKSFAQKMGASIHGQGKLSADLFGEMAITFLA
jgi:hypothetical protein